MKNGGVKPHARKSRQVIECDNIWDLTSLGTGQTEVMKTFKVERSLAIYALRVGGKRRCYQYTLLYLFDWELQLSFQLFNFFNERPSRFALDRTSYTRHILNSTLFSQR